MKTKLLLTVALMLLCVCGVVSCGGATEPPPPVMPDAVTSDGVALRLTDGGYAVIGYQGTSGHVAIPAVHEGLAIVGIDKSAFSGTSVESVTIPDSVLIVGDYAFSGCLKLNGVVFERSDTRLGNSVFRGCVMLDGTSLRLPSLSGIPDSTFFGCVSLKEITLPVNVAEIGVAAFWGCLRLESIEFPLALVRVGASAFEGAGLTSLTVPDTVTSIGKRAFASNASLTTVALGRGVPEKEFSSEIFSGCKTLVSVKIPHKRVDITLIEDSWKYVESLYASNALTGDAVRDYAFKSELLVRMVRIVLPDNITRIGVEAFSGAYNLEWIVLPASLKSIADSSFENCSKLASVTLPNGLIEIADRAWSGCSALAVIDIPPSVESVGVRAWGGCSRLAEITGGVGVKTLGNECFDGTKWYSEMEDGIVYFGAFLYNYKGAASQNTKIDDIRASTRTICENAFNGRANIISVIIPEGVTTIGREAFAYMPNLTEIKIAGSVTTIGLSAFYGCGRSENTMTVTLGDGIKTIAAEAFAYCFFREIEIPHSVTAIGASAFEDVKYHDGGTPASVTLRMNRSEGDTALRLGNNWNGSSETGKATVIWLIASAE